MSLTTKKHFGEKHVFTGRSDASTIELSAGAGETLTVSNLQLSTMSGTTVHSGTFTSTGTVNIQGSLNHTNFALGTNTVSILDASMTGTTNMEDLNVGVYTDA